MHKNAEKHYGLECPGSLVSVIMPVHNRKLLLEMAIDSVRTQTFLSWELLIVDDGSTDSLDALMEKFSFDARIRWIRLPKVGVCAARNKGLEEARGELVAYLDSDNIWYPQYLHEMVTAMLNEPQVDLAYGVLVTSTHGLDNAACLFKPFDWDELLKSNFIDINVFMHRRKLFPELGGFDETLDRLVDWDLILRYSKKRKVLGVKVLGAKYRILDEQRISDTALAYPNLIKIQKKWYPTDKLKVRLSVLYVVWHYPQLSETYIEMEIRQFLEWGVHIEVWCETDPAVPYPTDIRIHKNSLEEAVHDARPDLLHIHWISFALKQDAVLTKIGLPVTVRLHGFDTTRETIEVLLSKPWLSSIYAFPEQAAWFDVIDPRIKVVPACFDTILFQPSQQKDNLLVVRAGALIPSKDLRFVVEISKRMPDFRFSLAGIVAQNLEQYVDELTSLREKIGSSLDIQLNLPRAEIAKLIGQAGIYLHTNNACDEPNATPLGQPVSIAEAMATGAYIIYRQSPEFDSYIGDAGRSYNKIDEAIEIIAETRSWSDEKWCHTRKRSVERAYRSHADSMVLRTVFENWVEITALKNSTIWRLTKPVRFIGHQIARCKRAANIAASAFKIGGGFRSTLDKAFILYSREGVAGIKRGIRLILNGGIRPVNGSDGFDRNDYVEWVRRYDTIDSTMRAKLKTLSDGLGYKPKISIVMPTYNSKPEWLVEAIESVLGQIYSNWELCIADDASTDSTTRPILERYAQSDNRIKVVFREVNGHISVASNSAIELATGEWIALLDHDDLLSENALFWVADAINRNPDAGLIYSDEDKLSETNQRFDPYFKCDWNQDLFYSHNMISHLGVYKTTLVKRIGGFRQGFEGSQDYDLALRCIEHLRPNQIIHIPRMLYHWRCHSESMAKNSDAKPYAMLAGEKAINEHFKRIGVNGKITQMGKVYQPTYFLPDSPPLVSIVIPTRNGKPLLKKCISSILEKTTYQNLEILIVDNGSDDADTLEYLKSFSANERIRVIRDESPFNYSYINNKAVKMAKGEIVALLNNDIEVISPDWLSIMAAHALRPGIGAVGAKLMYPNKTLQHGGVILGVGGIAGHAYKHFSNNSTGYAGRLLLTQNLSAVTAACLVVKKCVFNEVDGLDEINLAVAFNDIDFCLRLKDAGYRNVWTPQAELFHHESATRGYEDTLEKQARYFREASYMEERWGNILLNDPAYSPNLTLDYEDFSYAWPPRRELI